MIEKERLEELIEQGATIYTTRYSYASCGIILDDKHFEVNDKYLVFTYKAYEILLEDLFEAEEEAKWYKEFGCIERTERLVLPTWEEFWNSGQTIWFTGKDGGQYGLSQYNREILLNDAYIGYLDKESYYKACRKCKEIFLGEKK